MKTIVSALVHSAKNLWDVVILIVFSLCMFSLVGHQMYGGLLTQKCIINFPLNGSEVNLTEDKWIKFNNNFSNWYYPEDTWEIPICGNATGSGPCPEGYTCLQGFGDNPNYGYTNFDSFGWSLLSSYRLMTQDYWEDLYQKILLSNGPWSMLFFIVVIFVGSFYLLTLILAVTFMSYHELRNKANEEAAAKDVLVADEDGVVVKVEASENPLIEQTDTLDVNDEEEKSHTTKTSRIRDEHDNFQLLHKLQDFVALIVLDPFVELFIIVCIALFTLFMALDHHDMTRDMELMLRNGRLFFMFVYVIEMVLKLIALLPKKFFQDKWNVVDLIVIILSVLELGLEGIQGLSLFRGLSLLLLLRWVHIARLAWPSLNRLLLILGRTICDLCFLVFIAFVGIVVFSLVGMVVYGKNYIDYMDRFPASELPRYNFADSLHSFIVVFRAFCGEWIESMWDCMLVSDVTCILFFLLISIVGNLFVLNLVTAVLLTNFRLSDESEETPGIGVQKVAKAFKRFAPLFTWIKCGTPDLLKTQQSPDRTNQTPAEGPSSAPKGHDKTFWQTWTNLRLKSCHLIENNWFKAFMILVILLNITQLAFEDVHLQQRPQMREVLWYVDLTCTLIFVAEMVIKWVALDFKGYFTNKWCWLDFIILMPYIINFVGIGIGADDLSFFRFMWALRALGPLRAISRWTGLRVVADALGQSFPQFLNGVVICFFVWLIFAILGVQMFAGKFYKCVDESSTVLSWELVPDRYVCIGENYTWENSPMNFDDVGHAYLSLLQVATFKGWIMIINDATDSRTIFKQPIREVNIYMYLYFVVFIIFSSFLTLNLFVGVSMDSFEKQKKKAGGSLEILMTDRQRRFYNTIKEISAERSETSIPRPSRRPRSLVFDISTSKKCDVTIMVFIAINTLVLMLEHYQESSSVISLLIWFDILFFLIITCVTVLKIIALRRRFFEDPWNVFDLVLVILSICGLLLNGVFMGDFGSSTLVGLMRIVRVWRLIKGSRALRTQLFAFARSLVVLCNVVLFLTVVTFAFANFGMAHFMHVRIRSGINDIFNFKTFPGSIFILFQVITTAGWDGVLDAIANESDCDQPDIENGIPGDCGSETIATIYMVLYVIVSFFIIMNMFRVVVLENCCQMKEEALKAKKRNSIEKSVGLCEMKLDQEASILNSSETAGKVLTATDAEQATAQAS